MRMSRVYWDHTRCDNKPADYWQEQQGGTRTHKSKSMLLYEATVQDCFFQAQLVVANQK